jgi:hypothetical protein
MEDALIEAVLRARATGTASSAADVFAALGREGLAVTKAEVKKACSKAAKRTGGLTVDTPTTPATLPDSQAATVKRHAKAAKANA